MGLRRQQPSIWLRTALWPAPLIYTATLVAAVVGLRGHGPLFVAFLATRGLLVVVSVAAVAAFEASRCLPARASSAYLMSVSTCLLFLVLVSAVLCIGFVLATGKKKGGKKKRGTGVVMPGQKVAPGGCSVPALAAFEASRCLHAQSSSASTPVLLYAFC